jgi:exosortase
MIPIPAQLYSSLTIPLQLLVSRISTEIAGLIGVPVFREGNVIHIPQQTLEVVQACSGLRSMMTLLTLSTVFGYLSLNSNLLRIGLAFTTIPAAILVNIVRVTAIIISLYYFNRDLMSGSLHNLTGVCMFLLSLIIFVAVRGIFSIWDTSSKASLSL